MVSILQFSCLKTNCQNFYLSQSDLTHLRLSSNLLLLFPSCPPRPPAPDQEKGLYRGWCWWKPASHQFRYKLGDFSKGCLILDDSTGRASSSFSFKWLGLVRSWSPWQGEAEVRSWITKWFHREPLGTVGTTCLAAAWNARHTRVGASDPFQTPFLPSGRHLSGTETEQLPRQARQFPELHRNRLNVTHAFSQSIRAHSELAFCFCPTDPAKPFLNEWEPGKGQPWFQLT